jgi:hypothetical protein
MKLRLEMLEKQKVKSWKKRYDSACEIEHSGKNDNS